MKRVLKCLLITMFILNINLLSANAALWEGDNVKKVGDTTYTFTEAEYEVEDDNFHITKYIRGNGKNYLIYNNHSIGPSSEFDLKILDKQDSKIIFKDVGNWADYSQELVSSTSEFHIKNDGLDKLIRSTDSVLPNTGGDTTITLDKNLDDWVVESSGFEHNNKIYLHAHEVDDDIDSYTGTKKSSSLYIYTNDGKHIKTIDVEKIYKEKLNPDYVDGYSKFDTIITNNGKVLLETFIIVMSGDKIQQIDVMIIDEEENVIKHRTIEENADFKYKNMAIYSMNNLFANNGNIPVTFYDYESNELSIIIYESGSDIQLINCSVFINDENGTRTIVKMKNAVDYYPLSFGVVLYDDGASLYDTNMNLITKLSDSYSLEVRELKNYDRSENIIGAVFSDNDKMAVLDVVKEKKNSNENNNKVEEDKSEPTKLNISGTIKKYSLKLKGYKLELHSEPKTTTLEDDGYFLFENVEVGEHTLILKDADGKSVASTIINVSESSETKLDGTTIYYNKDDKGINLNISVDGDKLKIDTIDKGTKEKTETIEENLKDIKPPKTFDNLSILIISLIILLISTIVLVIKYKKIKLIKID